MPPSATTFALPAPQGTEGAFEPHVSVDPADPNRIVVAAQYGAGYNRGGRHIWTWTSPDGGKTWTGADVPLPGAATVLAADAVTAFTADGRALLGFLYADSAFRGGAAVARTGPANLEFGPTRRVVADRLDQGGGAVDKGWLAVDRSPASPFRRAVYFSWHYNRPLPGGGVESALWGTSSTDGGLAWGEAVRVAPHFGGQFAVRADGTVDAVFEADSAAILHAVSTDGGRTFGAVDTVAERPVSTAVDLPTVAEPAGDATLVCWSEKAGSPAALSAVACAVRQADGRWLVAAIPDSAGVARGLPSVATNARGVWLLTYASDSTSTRVELWHSADGGRRFSPHTILAGRRFGRSAVCLGAATGCRKDPNVFFPGDYVGLAAASDRVVATFTLPEGDRPDGRSTVYVSVIRP